MRGRHKDIGSKLTKKKLNELYSINKLTQEQIGKMYDCSHKSIGYLMKKYKLPIRRLNIDKEKLKEMYIDKNKSIYQIAKKYGISGESVCRLLNKKGIKIRDASHRMQKYKINENFFENINSEEKAYWLGFLVADGSSLKWKLKLGLSIKDKNHLEKFRKALGSNHPLHIYKQPSINFHFENRKIRNDLTKINYKNIKISSLNGNLINHYIRGVFDGDGSIYKSFNKYCNCYNYGFSLIGKEFIINQIQQIFMNKIVLNKTKLYIQEPVVSMVYCGRNNIRRIYDYLYKNSSVWMDRKKDRFEEYINKEVNEKI